MTHAPESGVEFMAPISGAGFWSVCRWLKTTSGVKFDPRFDIYVPDFLYNEKLWKSDHDFGYF